MPKAPGTKDEMLSLTSATKTATTKTRKISTTVIAAAGTAGRSARPVSKKNATTTILAEKESPKDLPVKSQATIEAILNTLEEETMDKSWYNVLKPEFTKPYFKKLKQFLVNENASGVIYPPMEQIYTWSRLTPLDQVKVVILGQDPYHDAGQAHGLSFSVLPPTKTPGSLRNIYKQISQDIPGFVTPSSGDLSRVARLGVLWLNTSLTVRAHKAGSHSKKGWETFTAEVLRKVLTRADGERPGVVFMAWGLPAQKTCDAIGFDEKKHLVLKSAHPSPLSAHKGFLGNEHFKKANEWLEAKYGPGSGIDWNVLNAKSN